MEFDRESLGKLKLKGDDGLRELARKKGIKLKKGAGKGDVITALLKIAIDKKAGYDTGRAPPPPPPGMTQEQSKVEIKKRLDIMAREIYDKNSLLTTENERTAQIAEYDRIRRATQAFERSEAQREIQEVADRLNAQRNVDIWGDDQDFGDMIEHFDEMETENNQFFFEGADQSKEGLAIQSLYEDEFRYIEITDELNTTEYFVKDTYELENDETIFFEDSEKLAIQRRLGQKPYEKLPRGKKRLISGDYNIVPGKFASYLSEEGGEAASDFRRLVKSQKKGKRPSTAHFRGGRADFFPNDRIPEGR